jgi:hypothetical protein
MTRKCPNGTSLALMDYKVIRHLTAKCTTSSPTVTISLASTMTRSLILRVKPQPSWCKGHLALALSSGSDMKRMDPWVTLPTSSVDRAVSEDLDWGEGSQSDKRDYTMKDQLLTIWSLIGGALLKLLLNFSKWGLKNSIFWFYSTWRYFCHLNCLKQKRALTNPIIATKKHFQIDPPPQGLIFIESSLVSWFGGLQIHIRMSLYPQVLPKCSLPWEPVKNAIPQIAWKPWWPPPSTSITPLVGSLGQ